jgi:heat shock protein HtpX
MDTSSNLFGISLREQMAKNRWRTLYMFLIFPVLILGLTYLGLLISVLFSEETSVNPINIANEMMSTVGFWVIIGVIIWSIISYFWGSNMLMAFAGAKPIEKKDNPAVYRAVENASIAAGLPKNPDIYIINDPSLNAFSTGTNISNAKVAISQGLLEKLEKNELEAVMAHEIGHILNRDIRVMLLAITLVGAIEMIGEILIRTRGSSSRSQKGGNPLIIIGFLFLTIGVIAGTLARLAISREREYLADATSAHLTTNPLALVSALKKISIDPRIEILDKKASMAGLCIADPRDKGIDMQALSQNEIETKKSSSITGFWKNIWSTHPSIVDRINRLQQY